MQNSSLAHLHELKVVHRDIKPENVLLMGDDTLRLADFGLAKAMEMIAREDALTGIGSMLGTPEYMAPELLLGEAASNASDIFAYGVMMFEMLMGHRPSRKGVARSGDGGAIFEQQAIQDMPDILRRVVLKCTRFEPTERYPDAGALSRALAEGLPRIRRGKIRVRTEPAGAQLELNGKPVHQDLVEVESGVHILTASKGPLICPSKVVRVPPMATIDILLILVDPRAAETGGQPSDSAQGSAAVDAVLPFLAAARLKVVTRSLGYGTTKGIQDENSQQGNAR